MFVEGHPNPARAGFGCCFHAYPARARYRAEKQDFSYIRMGIPLKQKHEK